MERDPSRELGASRWKRGVFLLHQSREARRGELQITVAARCDGAED